MIRFEVPPSRFERAVSFPTYREAVREAEPGEPITVVGSTDELEPHLGPAADGRTYFWTSAYEVPPAESTVEDPRALALPFRVHVPTCVDRRCLEANPDGSCVCQCGGKHHGETSGDVAAGSL